MAQPAQPQREDLKPGARPNETVAKFTPKKAQAPKERENEPATNLQDDDYEAEDKEEDRPSQAI